jgi:hypothetical protein
MLKVWLSWILTDLHFFCLGKCGKMLFFTSKVHCSYFAPILAAVRCAFYWTFRYLLVASMGIFCLVPRYWNQHFLNSKNLCPDRGFSESSRKCLFKLLQSMNFSFYQKLWEKTLQPNVQVLMVCSATLIHTYVRIYCTLFSVQCTDKII